MNKTAHVIIVGGGAAGMAAAIAAAKESPDLTVTVYEPNAVLGRKLRITGKGRCNVTNDCSPAEVLDNVTKNRKFLTGAIFRYTPADVMSFFEENGVPLKTERGRRVFPVSDKAADISGAMERVMKGLGVRVVQEKVISLLRNESGVYGVKTATGEHTADAVIVATGGASYPGTGSRGDGYRFARDAGMAVAEPIPSLIPVITNEDTAPLSGLSLKNVTLSVTSGSKVVYSEMGEMLFTHFGVSGPLVLSASAHLGVKKHTYPYEALIDLTAEGVIPVCGARFTRHCGSIEFAGSVLEIALDQGVLAGGSKEQPLCEVEVELKSGEPEAAIAFAMELQRYFALVPQGKSKFRRALELAQEE